MSVNVPRIQMKFRALFFSVVLSAAWLLGGLSVSAHSPLDASARIILLPESVEVSTTVGTGLGEQFLATAEINRSQLPLGRPIPINAAMLTNFFAVTGDDLSLQPRAADVVTDGLEYQFRFEFARAAAKSLRVKANFLPLLRPPQAAALVLTDENGNILGSAVLTSDKSAAEFPLAAPVPVVAGLLETNGAVTNLMTAAVPAAAVERKIQPSSGEFFHLGVAHILTGYDHLLFLLALLLGCRRVKPMLWVVTGFTLAHSLTLALAALKVMTISAHIIEPTIAASIFCVAAENFRRQEKSWQRYALTCGFGLIHGFGFASALRASGLGGTGAEIVKPLLAFNLGVEAGQLAVAAVLLPLLLWLDRKAWFARHGIKVLSALVMALAVYWFWQRLG